MAAAMIFVGASYYYQFSNEIDARLNRAVFDNSARFVTSPVELRIGDSVTVNEIVTHLESAGYSRREKPTAVSVASAQKQSSRSVRPEDGLRIALADQSPSSFAVGGRIIRAIPSEAAQRESGAGPFQIEVDARNRIAALTDSASGARLSSISLEPALLAALKQGDRKKKTEVVYSEIPDILVKAVVATEDQRFFDHWGVDVFGMARAAVANIRQGAIVQGGSTITQQVVKNAFLTRERTFKRKAKESAMALILESRLSKEEILALYCSDVYLGHSTRTAVHGFAEGARFYFDKDLNQLTAAECAFLAGLIHAPNRYSAHRNLDNATERRNRVLDAMLEMEILSAEEVASAKAEPVRLKKHEIRDDFGISYFVDYAQRFLEQRYGDEALDSLASIETTLDLQLQRAAFESVTNHIGQFHKRKGEGPQAALVALNPHTGEVLAMVGGLSYDQSQLNRTTDALRQPGSAFKPFVYAAAMTQGHTAASLLSNRPRTFIYDGGRAEYTPENYGGSFSYGDVTLAEAFSRSLNVPAVELAQKVGLGSIADFSELCGLPRPRPYPSMALGVTEVSLLDLASAYTVFANSGTAVKPSPIRETRGLDSEEVTTIAPTTARAISPQIAYLMTQLMASVVDHGTGARVRAMGLKGEMAGKTGSSRDGWFVGYTPNLVCAVWVGYDDNRDLRLTGSQSALPIWVDFMKRALEIRPELGGSFKQPSGLTVAVIDPTTGMLATDMCPVTSRVMFASGTDPFVHCTHELLAEELELEMEEEMSDVEEERSGSVSWEICSVTGLLPLNDCPRRSAVFDLSDFPIEICRRELHDRE